MHGRPRCLIVARAGTHPTGIGRAMDLFLKSLLTFFITVEPLGLMPLFAALAGHDPPADRDRTARRAVLIATGVLAAFILAGRLVLQAFGISLAALQIAAGAFLFLVSVDMVLARQSGLRGTTEQETSEARSRPDISVFPLAVPLIAGPAAISAAILLGGQAPDPAHLAGVLVAAALVLIATLACLGVAGRLSRYLGVTGVNVINRILGIVLGALAIQFIIDGLKGAFPGL